MKILIVQLARLGDIYLSWPAIRALRRTHPDAEIHVLTRPKFSAALNGLTAVDKVIQLPTTEILSPLVQMNLDVPQAFQKMSEFSDSLGNEAYDWIVNLSFSPFSSYLTHAITHPHTRVTGYTRFQDGFLSIPDDMSAYFYSQVGIGRPNRFHLIEIFASMLSLDLIEEDWQGPSPFPTTAQELPEDYVIVHVGASEATKSLKADAWVQILENLAKLHPIHTVLIGSAAEATIAEEIVEKMPPATTINLVGKTQLNEIFPIIQNAKLVIGCDSMPMHVATLTKTPCVNISLAAVNFWETGPRAMGSVVLRFRSADELQAEKVAIAARKVLAGEKPDLSSISVISGTPSYYALFPKHVEFEWNMLRAIYLGENFPANETNEFKEAIRNLAEINQLMMEQMDKVSQSGDVSVAGPLIERGEDIIETIGKLVPSTQALIRWYQTEKIRIALGEMTIILARTIEVHKMFQKVIDLYMNYEAYVKKEIR